MENIIDFDNLPEMNQEPRYIKEVELPSGMSTIVALTGEEIAEVKRRGAMRRKGISKKTFSSEKETETPKSTNEHSPE
ncbi:hypothetical protein EVA_21085, partial [gut metagenome]